MSVLTMFLTKKHLDRRTFLRGMGATVALPLLDAMIPARTLLALTAARAVPRLAFVYFPHGAIMDEWTASGRILQTAGTVPRPADDRQRPRESPRLRTGARDHAWHWLSGDAGARAAASTADQLAADHLGCETAVAVDRCRDRRSRRRSAPASGKASTTRVMARRSRSAIGRAGADGIPRRARCSTPLSPRRRSRDRRASSISLPLTPRVYGNGWDLRIAPC